MNLKSRLQRMLQIVEDAERNGALADIERDILLNELREAYAMLRFVDDYEPQQPTTAVPLPADEEADVEVDEEPIEEPIEDESIDEPAFEPTEEEEDEPEVEVELIFNEEDDEEEEQEEEEEEEEVVVEFEPEETPAVVEEPIAEPVSEPIAEEPVAVEEEPVAVEEEPAVAAEELPIIPIVPTAPATPATPATPITPTTPKRSSILSLYDEDPAPVVGEQFRETPSVADVISAQKGVSVAPSVTSLRSAIGVADKFMFIRELFNDDVEAYEEAIDKLEALPSLDDCVIYISENYAWSPTADSTKRVMELLQRKYK